MAESYPYERKPRKFYGLIAQFETPDHLMEAAERSFAEGYRVMDAYTPYPVEGLAETLGRRGSRLQLIVLGGGIAGLVAGFGLQYYASVIDYPINVGGRPLNSWPAFVPITFELMILFAAFAAVLGMFFLNGLPQPYHPVFNAPNFELASRSHFFLAIESRDPLFDPDRTQQFLADLGATQVSEVEY